jgi:hypothetical protein
MELMLVGGSGGRGKSSAAGADKLEREQRSIQERLLITLGSAQIFIKSVLT